MGGRARAYGANKRRKELARKAKQEEKRRRRQERKGAPAPTEGMAPEAAVAAVAPEGGPPVAEGVVTNAE